MNGSGPCKSGAAPFIEEQIFEVRKSPAAPESPPRKTFLSEKKPPSDVQGKDIAMLRLAEALWTENLFRKLHPLLKEDLVLLFHPRALLKALYFLSSDQRSLLLSLEKKNREIAAERNVKVARVITQRRRCLQKLATAIGDIRAYIFTLRGLPIVSVELQAPDLKLRKTAKRKTSKGPSKAMRKKLLARIPRPLRPGPDQLPPNEELFFAGPVLKKPRWLQRVTGQATKKTGDFVSGWPKKFLTDELGIEIPVPKQAWKNAFNELWGSERDVVRFRAKGGSFAAFSREYYGSSPTARATYNNALNKLFEILAVL